MKADFSGIKIKADSSIIGKYVIIPGTETSEESFKTIPSETKIFCKVTHTKSHSLIRHDLFAACVKLVSDNTGKPEYQIREQCKLDCRWIRGYTYYKDKDGKERINVITRSIAFSEMSLKDADDFYGQAFNILAGYLKITTEEMTEEAKSRMKPKYTSALKKNSMQEGVEPVLNEFESEKPKSIPEEPVKQSTERFIDPNAAIRAKILIEYKAGKIDKNVAMMEFYQFGGDAREIDPTWVDPEY